MIPKPDADLKSTVVGGQVTDEDIVYCTMVESHPILESLVNRFDLCSIETGDRFNKTEKRVAIKPQRPILTSEELLLLRKIVDRILNSEENYEKNVIAKAKQRETKRIKKRAANKFEQMVEAAVNRIWSRIAAQ